MARPAMILLVLLAACGAACASENPFPMDWTVFGRITDLEGKGMEGVLVVAHCGWGTLLPKGEAASGPDGAYTLRFAPGVFFTGGKGVVQSAQAAIISARKTGFRDRNLSRQGDLLMAETMPATEDLNGRDASKVVLKGTPYRVDFVMVPTACIKTTVTDADRGPIRNAEAWVDGKDMPPASSALAQAVRTDAEGKAALDEIPTGYRWRINIGDDMYAEVAIETPGMHEIALRKTTHPAGGWWMIEIESHRNAKGESVRPSGQDEPPWTGKDGMLKSRLRAEKVLWAAGETPVLAADLQNESGKAWDVPADQCKWWVEVDGKAFKWSLKHGPVRKANLEAGKSLAGTKISLGRGWADESGNDLKLGPGRHTIRVSCGCTSQSGSTAATSNRVTIEVSE